MKVFVRWLEALSLGIVDLLRDDESVIVSVAGNLVKPKVWKSRKSPGTATVSHVRGFAILRLEEHWADCIVHRDFEVMHDKPF